MLTALMVLVFWFRSATLAGQRPDSMAADVLLSVLLIWQAARALHQPPSQRDLCLLVVVTGSLLLASRALAVPGSPFLVDAAYMPVVPVAAAWAVWSSALLVAPVPVLLVVLATGAWRLGAVLPVEQASAALTTVACTFWAVRLLRARARRADAAAEALSRRMAAQDAALAAEEAERRAANAVHDDVLSVLRAVIVADQQVPWSLMVAKALRAQNSLARQVPGGGHGSANLGSALRRAAGSAAELDVRCDLDDDLDMPLLAVEALSAAVGEGLRNVAAHARVRSAVVTGRRRKSGGVVVTVSDGGIGFAPALVGPASTGLRNSIRARMSDIGGHAEILSAPGQGTSVVLTWNPPQPASTPAVDHRDWARRMTPNSQLICVGFMLPFLLASLFWLCLRWQDMRWQDMRWQGAVAVVFGGALVLAILSARYLSQVRMTQWETVGLAAGNAILVAVGSLAVAPGTTDALAYWVAGASGIVIAAIYFIQGSAFGLANLGLDVAALTVGLVVTGGIAADGWVSILASPAIGAGLAAAMLAAFCNLSSYTESQLAAYRERLRWQARAEAVSRVDDAALDNARHLAGPVLDAVISSPAPTPDLRTAAALASANLRDELLAPGFLTATLGDQVRAARAIGARITVDFARQSDAALVQTARALLAAALADLDVGDDVTLQVHPSAERHPALLIVHARSRRSVHAALRRRASECGALINDLDDGELLIRFKPMQERAAVCPPLGGYLQPALASRLDPDA